MFGIRPKVRAHRAAKAAARETALGFVDPKGTWTAATEAAERILAEAEAEEARERDIVEAFAREDSAIDVD